MVLHIWNYMLIMNWFCGLKGWFFHILIILLQQNTFKMFIAKNYSVKQIFRHIVRIIFLIFTIHSHLCINIATKKHKNQYWYTHIYSRKQWTNVTYFDTSTDAASRDLSLTPRNDWKKQRLVVVFVSLQRCFSSWWSRSKLHIWLHWLNLQTH